MNTPQSEREIFLAALELEAPNARAEYLDSVCRDDDELRARVEALLSAAPKAAEFLTPQQGLNLTIIADDFDEELLQDKGFDFLKPSDKEGCMGLLDHYEVIGLLGRGAFGIVFRAYDTRLNRVVAIKVLAPAFANNPMAVRRFLREAQAAAAVRHDHVVTLHSVEQDHQPPYIVMEHIEGESLKKRVDEQGPLELVQILRIGMQMAGGLAAAHAQGLVHRDIKPANILLEDGSGRAKLTDFGLARAVDDVGMTQTGTIAGTPQYMSPEQGMGQTLDERSDLFSLGTVLYELCTGRSPFRADSTVATLRRICDDEPRPISSINADMPKWLEKLIMRLLEKRPQDRIQTAAETEEAFRKCLAHLQSDGECSNSPTIPGITDQPRRPNRTAKRLFDLVRLRPLAQPFFQAGILVQPIVLLHSIVCISLHLETAAFIGILASCVIGLPMSVAGFFSNRRWGDIALPLAMPGLAYAITALLANLINHYDSVFFISGISLIFFAVACCSWTFIAYSHGTKILSEQTTQSYPQESVLIGLSILQLFCLPLSVSMISYNTAGLGSMTTLCFGVLSLTILATTIIQKRSWASKLMGAAPPLVFSLLLFVAAHSSPNWSAMRESLQLQLLLFNCFTIPFGFLALARETRITDQTFPQFKLLSILGIVGIFAISMTIASPNLDLGIIPFFAATLMLVSLIACCTVFLIWWNQRSDKPQMRVRAIVLCIAVSVLAGFGIFFSYFESEYNQGHLYVLIDESETFGKKLEITARYEESRNEETVVVLPDGKWFNGSPNRGKVKWYLGPMHAGNATLELNDKEFRLVPNHVALQHAKAQVVRIEKIVP